MKLKTFTVLGLFGNRDVELPLDDEALILVGPNGLGKSSVANIFYFFVSRQWRRLLEYQFEKIHITISEEKLTMSRDQISGLLEVESLLEELPSRSSMMIRKLISAGEFHSFVGQTNLSLSTREKFSKILEIPRSEISSFQRWLVRRLDRQEDIISSPIATIEERLVELSPSRVLYLPTFRRIERDVRDIFPELAERYRRFSGPDVQLTAGRSGDYYIELVSFGMEDVKNNIKSVTNAIKDYSLTQYNSLSASYLKDVIRGKADTYNARHISRLTEESINSTLDRVSETALSSEDKSMLRRKIKVLQNKRKSEAEPQDRYLAHYFSKLLSLTADLLFKEQDIANFVDVCNAYLRPSKQFYYDETKYYLSVLDDRDKPLDLSVLSSGEKQIISVFSHLYLDQNTDQIMIIDEPELSLSVPWQRRFLPDILKSNRCSFVLAVTHSPFVYDNELKHRAKDLRRLTSRY